MFLTFSFRNRNPWSATSSQPAIVDPARLPHCALLSGKWCRGMVEMVGSVLVGLERISLTVDRPDPAGLALVVPELLAQPSNMHIHCS